MTGRWLPAVVVGAALVAAWGAARYAGCVTLLFTIALVATLALPPAERLFFSREWLVVLVVVLTVSWAVAFDHELALRHTLTFVLAALLFGLARRAGTGDSGVFVLALGVAATAVVALSQVLPTGPPPADALTTIAPELRERALARLAVGRASGTASVPGHFAALLVTVAPLLVAGVQRRTHGWQRAVAVAGLLLVASGIVASRSVIAVGVAVGLAAVALALRRPTWKPILAGAMVLAAVAATTASLRTDLSTLEPVRMRWVNWKTSGWVLWQHAPLGVGLGGVGQAGLTGPAGAANLTPYAHNTFLQLGAELGLAGLAISVAGALALWRLFTAGARDHLPLVLAVAALPLHNLVDFSAYSPEVIVPWAVLAGTLVARVTAPPGRPLRRWPLLFVLGGGVILAAVSWRAESLLTASYSAPAPRSVDLALAAARWAPWTASPVVSAAGVALLTSDPRVLQIDRELERRWWVRPVSSTWAEAHSRLLLASGRSGEAVVWAREARRRAPWRGDLVDLEAACRGTS